MGNSMGSRSWKRGSDEEEAQGDLYMYGNRQWVVWRQIIEFLGGCRTFSVTIGRSVRWVRWVKSATRPVTNQIQLANDYFSYKPICARTYLDTGINCDPVVEGCCVVYRGTGCRVRVSVYSPLKC